MTTGTPQRVSQAQAHGRSITVALLPATQHSLGQLQEHTGLSQADLANCAITWYAYFDTQLRAGYSLTLWNGETRKAYTLSLPGGSPTAAHHVRWLPGNGQVRSAMTAPYSQATWPSLTQAFRPSYGLSPPAPVITSSQPWLTVVTSRGSPDAAPCGGGLQPMCRSVTGLPAWQQARVDRNGGPS
jgi:hypothetical protein